MKDVHTEHCCILHGCKYGKNDICTVLTGKAPQSFPCESCYEDGIESSIMIQEVITGKQPRCPHCNHVL